jgi:hypothetical protein
MLCYHLLYENLNVKIKLLPPVYIVVKFGALHKGRINRLKSFGKEHLAVIERK